MMGSTQRPRTSITILLLLALNGAMVNGRYFRGTSGHVQNAFNATVEKSLVEEQEHRQAPNLLRVVLSKISKSGSSGVEQIVEKEGDGTILRILKKQGTKPNNGGGKTKVTTKRSNNLFGDWSLCSTSVQCACACCSPVNPVDGQWRCTPQNGGACVTTSPPVVPATPAPVAPAITPPVIPPTTGAIYGLQQDCYQDDASRYNICLDLGSKTGMYQPWMESAIAARDRWQNVISADIFPKLESALVDPILRQIPGGIVSALPPFIDDIYIAITEGDFARPEILAQGGPTVGRRTSTGKLIPVSGLLQFQSSYIAQLQSQNGLTNLFAHEIGHVLGFGTLFATNGLHSGSVSDSTYTGQYAIQEWRNMGCSGGLPIETRGGPGTAGSHWDEACLDKELMTGIDDTNTEYLSRLTIAAMQDLGYSVNLNMADPFSLDQLSQSACAAFCPEARGAFSVEASSITSSSVSSLETSPPAGTQGQAALMSVAASVLAENRANAPPVPEGYTYIGGDIVTMYTLDADGRIKGTTVTWDEAQAHLSGNLVV